MNSPTNLIKQGKSNSCYFTTIPGRFLMIPTDQTFRSSMLTLNQKDYLKRVWIMLISTMMKMLMYIMKLASLQTSPKQKSRHLRKHRMINILKGHQPVICFHDISGGEKVSPNHFKLSKIFQTCNFCICLLTWKILLVQTTL